MGSFLKPTKEKVILSLFNSLLLILLFLVIPSLGFQSIFLSGESSGQIFSLIVSYLFGFVAYYPLACGFIYIFKIITGKEKATVRTIVIAVLFIIIFNPITFSMVVPDTMKKTWVNSPKEKLCGLQIIEVTAPSAKNAGLVVSEVINTVNDYPVDTMDALNHALTNKKPNDTVTVITNANTYNVTLFTNPKNPQQVLLGIKVKPTECENSQEKESKN